MAHRNFQTRKQARLQHDANLAAHREHVKQIAGAAPSNQSTQQTAGASPVVENSTPAGGEPVKGNGQ